MMDEKGPNFASIETFRSNFSAAESDDEHFQLCWAQQNCGGCLNTDRCSWCPFTWSCVPNGYRIPMLAPAYNEDICPHWAERWEIRTRPLGCQVSTITSLTSIVTILCTLAVVLLVGFGVFGFVRWREKMKNGRRSSSWISRWRGDEDDGDGGDGDGEREPLLFSPGEGRQRHDRNP